MLVHPLGRAPLSRLRPRHTGLVRAGADDVLVLDGAPILLDDAADWCARHRDSIIATIATFGGDVAAAVATVDAVVAGAPPTSQTTFVDDFTPAEAQDLPPPALVDEALQDLLDEGATPLRWLAARVPRGAAMIELGPGAGGLSAVLAGRAARRLVLIDVSLRAVLLARRAAGDRATAVVADAANLPVADAAADVVVAQNVVDVVDDPDAMIAGIHRALKPGGTFALTTPDPDLGPAGGDDIDSRLRDAGFVIDDIVDDLRWPRVHGRRHVELWTCRGVIARRR